MPSDKLEIAAVDVRNFKRVSDVHIDTSADRNLLLIAGRNAQGKSSLLDAITVALGGGTLPADPVRHGADRAEIVVELAGGRGRYKVTKTIAGPGKDPTLKIVGPDGPVGKPQTWLDNLVVDKFIDPIAFISKKAPDQRKALLDAVGVDVDGLDGDRKRAFDTRTVENGALKAAQTRRAGLQPMTAAPDAARPIDQIQRELDEVDAAVAAGADAVRAAEKLAGGIGQLEQEQALRRAGIERLRREVEAMERSAAETDQRIERGRALLAEAHAKAPTQDAVGDLTTRKASLREEQRRSSAAAAWRAQKQERDRQIATADAEVAARQAASDRLTAEIEAIDEMKAAMLAGADMPVPGLAVTDDGITLAGASGPVPFTQASQAEQLRAAVAIAMRRQGLRDVMVRHGSLLDEDGIERLRQVAAELDCRVWLERVGEADGERAIIIRDGRVVGASGGEAA